MIDRSDRDPGYLPIGIRSMSSLPGSKPWKQGQIVQRSEGGDINVKSEREEEKKTTSYFFGFQGLNIV
mgnify:CR=1 FL=1